MTNRSSVTVQSGRNRSSEEAEQRRDQSDVASICEGLRDHEDERNNELEQQDSEAA